MAKTTAAIKAAKEVHAEENAPEFYREATETFLKSKHEYRLKNFKKSKELAIKARHFAEQAEYVSMQKGGVRKSLQLVDPLAEPQSSENTEDDYEIETAGEPQFIEDVAPPEKTKPEPSKESPPTP
tara:strand:- start:914 stop:1291 length:378 start_codon:yes stop_codon:yes gene_type:complete